MNVAVQRLPAASTTSSRGYLRFWVTLVVLLATDQLTKLWVVKTIEPNTYFDPRPALPVINGFFYFVNITNHGAAWGMFDKYTPFLALLGLAALLAIFFFRRQLELHRPLLQYAFGLLCGGIIGNMIDRQWHGQVVDFLDFHLPGYRYPAFNVADAGITVGVFIYVLFSFKDAFPWRRTAARTTTSADSVVKQETR